MHQVYFDTQSPKLVLTCDGVCVKKLDVDG